jgi:hypothetical protein
LGEDACLTDYDESQDDCELEDDRICEELNAEEDVDNLVQHLSQEWQKEQKVSQLQNPTQPIVCPAAVEVPAESSEAVLAGSAEANVQCQSALAACFGTQVSGHASSDGNGDHESDNRNSLSSVKRKVQRTSSCPPGRVHTTWARRHKDVVICDARHKDAKGKSKSISGDIGVIRKKGAGQLRHCAINLKRIARLSDKDRKDVLLALH